MLMTARHTFQTCVFCCQCMYDLLLLLTNTTQLLPFNKQELISLCKFLIRHFFTIRLGSIIYIHIINFHCKGFDHISCYVFTCIIRIIIRPSDHQSFLLLLEISRALRFDMTKSLTFMTLNAFSYAWFFIIFEFALKTSISGVVKFLHIVGQFVSDIWSWPPVKLLEGSVKLSS